MSLYKAKNFIDSLKFALSGMLLAFKTQRNIKIDLVLAFIAIIFSIIFKLNSIEWALIVFCIILVVSFEMLNTAIETFIDLHYADNYSQIAKNTKDIAAGAVLCSAIGSLIVGALIFIPKVIYIIYG